MEEVYYELKRLSLWRRLLDSVQNPDEKVLDLYIKKLKEQDDYGKQKRMVQNKCKNGS